MITGDPYGISGAVRVWDSPDAGKRQDRRKRKVNQRDIDRCLNCTADDCSGNCRGRPPAARSEDPCLSCYSAKVCQQGGYTCVEKERWKGKLDNA